MTENPKPRWLQFNLLPRTVNTPLILWVRRLRMLLAYSICTGMCGNGVRTVMTTMKTLPILQPLQGGWQGRVSQIRCAAVHGRRIPRAVGQLIHPGNIPNCATTLLVSVSRTPRLDRSQSSVLSALCASASLREKTRTPARTHLTPCASCTSCIIKSFLIN